jgi:predicted acetyltransferase
MLKLVPPNLEYQQAYLLMMEKWYGSGEQPTSWVLKEDYSDFPALVARLEGYSRGVGVAANFVPSTTRWGWDDESGSIVGAVNIRHHLNESLLKEGGNIGYAVSPLHRRKGFAAEMLRQSLEICAHLGMTRALVTCNQENIASARTILKNGGILENEILDEETGKIIQRYWIQINPPA